MSDASFSAVTDSSGGPDYSSLVDQNIWKGLQTNTASQMSDQLLTQPIPQLAPVAPMRLQPMMPGIPQAFGGGGYSGPTGSIDSSNRVVQEALSFRGDPYRWGGTSRSGLDCSGLVQDVYAAMGIKLPRTTYEQANVGQAVNGIQNARPGDLIFFDNHGHVGIYAGNGQMIDANHTGGWVDVRPISGYGAIAGIRRVMG